MKTNEFLFSLHELIRKEYVALSTVDKDSIIVRFVGEKPFKIQIKKI